MNERQTNPSPEQALRSQLSVKDFDKLREAQVDDYLDGMRSVPVAYQTERQSKRDELYSQYPVSNAMYLESKGIGVDHPQRSDYENLLAEVSLDQISEREWYVSSVDAQGNRQPSPRQNFEARLEELQQQLVAGENAPINTEKDPAIERAKERLATLRDELALLTAKRQGKAVSLSSEKYDAAREAYNKQLAAVGKLEIASIGTEGEPLSDAQKNVATIAYLLDEQKVLREKTTEALAGTKTSRFIEYMNKGNVAQRVAKGVGLGLVVGTAGAAAGGVIAGAAGIAAVGTGAATAATLVNRFARGFALRDHKQGRGMSGEFTEKDQRTIQNRVNIRGGNAIDETVSVLDSLYDRDTRGEQKKRRKSVAWGVGGIALGSVVAYGVHELAGAPFDKMHNSVFGAEDGQKLIIPATGVEYGDSDHGVDNGAQSDYYPELIPLDIVDKTPDIFDGSGVGTEFTAAGLKDFNGWIDGHKVASGDSVWKLSEKYLETHGVKDPTTTQIDAVKDRVLADMQSKGLADKRGWLQAGAIIKSK